MSQLAIGDVVILKSGSPNMTVCRVDDDAGVECVWFTDALESIGSIGRQKFHPDCLIAAAKPLPIKKSARK